MPSYGVGVTLQYIAWNTSTNAYVTGDSANHTLRWVKDGTSSATTNSPSEVDSTNAPGVYKVVLTTTETSCQVGTLAGKSSTSNVVLIGMTCTFENLPTASPGQANGVFIAGSNAATSVTTALTANITGNLSGSVGSVTGAVGSVTGNVGGNVTGSVGSVVATVSADVVSISGDSGAADNLETACDGGAYNIGGGSVVAASVTGAVGSVTGNVGGNVTGSVGSVASGGIASTSFASGAITAAAIATDAIDADALAADAVTEIWAKAMTELTSVPGVTGTVLQALSWCFTVARNKITQTATTQTVYRDDGSTSLATSTVSDDGTTFTRGELA